MPRPKGIPKTGGRVQGTPNRRTKHAEEFAQSFLRDGDFQDAVRMIMSNPHHEHWKWTVELVMNYAYGKPTEHVHQTSDGSLPQPQVQVAWMDYRQFFASQDPLAIEEVNHDSSPV